MTGSNDPSGLKDTELALQKMGEEGEILLSIKPPHLFQLLRARAVEVHNKYHLWEHILPEKLKCRIARWF